MPFRWKYISRHALRRYVNPAVGGSSGAAIAGGWGLCQLRHPRSHEQLNEGTSDFEARTVVFTFL